MSTATQDKVSPGQLTRRLIKAAKEFNDDDMLDYGAAISFQVFFSLFPFLFFLLALLGALDIPGLLDWLLNQAQTVLPGQAAGVVEQTVEQIRSQAQGTGLLSFWIIFTLWTASSAVRTTMQALNVAYDVAEERPVWKRYPLSILYTILLAVLIIVAVGLMVIGPQIVEWLAQQIGLGSAFVTLWQWVRIPAAILLITVVLALVYYLFPNVDQPFRLITPGAVLAVIVWLVASFGFSYYVNNFANYNAVYGSLGAVIVLLAYLYISACVLLFGAEVNEQIYHQFAKDKDEDEEPQKESGPTHK
jgi:membrane protein